LGGDIAMSAEPVRSPNQPSGFGNWISLAGFVLSIGSLFSFLLLYAIDTMAQSSSPYLGILTFVVAPGFLVLGLVLLGLGWLLQRRQASRVQVGGKPSHLLTIDLSRAQDRRALALFVTGAAIFIMISAVASYRSYRFAESVQFCGQTCHSMNPEFVAYQNSPHAHVGCTECHVGEGATGFVKAKLNGVHQLVETIANSHDRPIKTPKELLPAQETCEHCHWPKKYIGDVEKSYTHFLSDDSNTVYTVRMFLKVGGGDSTHGPVGGIHWHMNLANKVEFITTDDKRQEVPWVRFTDAQGKVTEYQTKDFKDDPARFSKRIMDCMDCHNRPAHQFRPPNDMVEQSLAQGRIDPSIPSIKAKVAAALVQTNIVSTHEGVQKVAAYLKAAYTTDSRIDKVIAEAQQIYRNGFFPEMKTDWQVHPDNIGHKNWPGCFRCHDGKHVTADGKKKIEASNCNDCHLIISQGSGEELAKWDPKGLKFAHPDTSSEGTDPDCSSCHTGGP